MGIFQTNAYIQKIETTADRCLKIKLSTQELPAETKAQLFDLQDKFIFVAFKEAEKGDIIEEELEIPEVNKIEKDAKTPSQRLRNTIYVFYLQQNKGKEDFDTFYRRNMEKIINRIKDELN